MRKHYLDNLRTIMVLLLFVYHTFMIWNNFGSMFYIWGGENNIISSLIVLISPWFMSLLFIIAGISARYSLEKRSKKEFIKERFNKLFLPFVIGLILLVPLQTLISRKFFFNYSGGFLDNLKFFFTNFTDLNGYDGCFTLGHLWFIFYLFIISLVSLLLIKYISYDKVKSKLKKINIAPLILLFVPLCILNYIGNFGGQSIFKYLALYLIGYYILDDDNIKEIMNNKVPIILFFLISQVALSVIYYLYGSYNQLFVNFVGWFGILFWIIIGNMFLNKKSKLSEHFSKLSYNIYLIHFPILVIVGYFSIIFISNIYIQVFTIIFASFIITLIVCEIINLVMFLGKKKTN